MGVDRKPGTCDKLLRKARLHVVDDRHFVAPTQQNGGESRFLDRVDAGISTTTEGGL